MDSHTAKVMDYPSTDRQSLAIAPVCLGSFLLMVALTLTPPVKAQMLMNLAPQALPSTPVGPTYSGTLDAIKQRINAPASAPTQAKPPQSQSSRPVASRSNSPRAISAAPAGDVCELRVFQMNDIQRNRVVRVHSGPCLMVFNAND